MNLLVTGGAGFIGSHFVELALLHGNKVVVLDALTYAGSKANLEFIKPSLKLNMAFVHGNICNGALVSGLLREHSIDAVINFAAESHVDNSIASPAKFMETNIQGVYVLLEASRNYWGTLKEARKSKFRFLQVSTDEVFGTLGKKGAFRETSRYQPNSPYSATKAGGDHLVRAWHETYGLPTLTTHCSNNYGPKQHKEKLIPHMIHSALGGKPLPIYGTGNNIRDWIHVTDHANGIYLTLTKANPGSVYCFGGRAEYTNKDTVKLICDILDKEKPKSDGSSYATQITYVTDRLGHDFRYAIDDSKAEKDLGFKRKYNFEEGLKETVKWYLK